MKKYLLPVTLLLVLLGCERNSSEPQNHTGVPASEKEIAENALDYLDKSLQGKVSQRGLYRMVRSGGVKDDPDTSTGKVVSHPVIQLVESTERIPLVKGAQMYLQYRIWPFPDRPAYVDLRRVLKHPEMELPDGSISTGSDFKIKRRISSNHVIAYTGYGFDEDYELVEGEWVFEIWYKDKKLIEQKFTTYWPDEEEIAALVPVLQLGNEVLTRMQSPDNPDSRLNWPRVIVGEKNAEVPSGVSETIRSMDEPVVQP